MRICYCVFFWTTFVEEDRKLLEEAGIEFDERYIL
jgi:hypothetical protein